MSEDFLALSQKLFDISKEIEQKIADKAWQEIESLQTEQATLASRLARLPLPETGREAAQLREQLEKIKQLNVVLVQKITVQKNQLAEQQRSHQAGKKMQKAYQSNR